MLNVKTRQNYLKELGYYKGEIDGKVGPKTKAAYKALQKDYFIRSKDIDGVYGKNTDILLTHVYRCKDLKYFNAKEFKCTCNGKYCTGYPAPIDNDLVRYLDELREYLGVPITIESGLRCATRNKQVGGVSNSNHKYGYAVDTYSTKHKTLEQRKALVNYWIEHYEKSNYAYCNSYGRTKSRISYPKASGMGNSVHIDVK